ncbi:MAG: hypothetical protein KC766_03415 [Myxococcales bacterium]|nr:hypothetical protein [Myxococcales bacterium]
MAGRAVTALQAEPEEPARVGAVGRPEPELRLDPAEPGAMVDRRLVVEEPEAAQRAQAVVLVAPPATAAP